MHGYLSSDTLKADNDVIIIARVHNRDYSNDILR